MDITFDYPMDGDKVDSIMLPSSTSWVQFQEEMCTAMELHIKDLKLGYKFSTHTQREAPQVLNTLTAFIKMKEAATAHIHEQETLKGRAKKGKSEAFWVILIDSGKKTHEKAAPVKGKVSWHILSLFDMTDLIGISRKQAPQ